MAEISYEAARWNGPKVVALGGGTGLSTMLRGLKKYTENITALVTVADDGGNSGMLRNDLGMLPPGDIRNCILALSNTEPLMASLIDYRFSEGCLSGQNIGNLIIAALNDICGSFNVAIALLCQVLAVTGKVLPITLEDVTLEAEFENGARVSGESNIARHKKEQNCRVRKVRLVPGSVPALGECLDALRTADMIVFGPGSLYTSIVPNLLVGGVCEAVMESRALKVYVCNAMTQDGETEGYSVSDHLAGLLEHAYPNLVDVCLANCQAVSAGLRERYGMEDAEQTLVDRGRVRELGVALVEREIISEGGGYVRHDPKKLAIELIGLHHDMHDRGDLRRFDTAMRNYITRLSDSPQR